MVEKNEDPAWSVTNSRLVIDLYRENPVLYDKNHKDYENKAITMKVFALILNFWTSFHLIIFIHVHLRYISILIIKPSSGEYQLSQSKFHSFAPSCVL